MQASLCCPLGLRCVDFLFGHSTVWSEFWPFWKTYSTKNPHSRQNCLPSPAKANLTLTMPSGQSRPQHLPVWADSWVFECVFGGGFHFTYASHFHLVQEQQPAYPALYRALLPISAYCKVDAASTDVANLSAVACDCRWELPSLQGLPGTVVSPFGSSWCRSPCIFPSHQGYLLRIGNSLHLFSIFRRWFGHSKQAGGCETFWQSQAVERKAANSGSQW